MLALDLGERIAERAKEIRVGRQHIVPSMVNSITACDLPIASICPAKFGRFQLVRGDVGGEFHHLERLAGHRRGSDCRKRGSRPPCRPCRNACTRRPRIHRGRAWPRIPDRRRCRARWAPRTSMMLALDFLQPVAHRGEEVLIGGDDGAVEIEFDHRLRTADGGNLAGILHVADFLRRDVGGEFDDFHGRPASSRIGL